MHVPGPVIARQEIPFARLQVWQAVADHALRANWAQNLSVTPRLYGEVSDGKRGGKVNLAVRGHVLGWGWGSAEYGHTLVLLTLRTLGDNTLVTVQETGFSDCADPAAAHTAALEFWQQALQALAMQDLSEVVCDSDFANLQHAFQPDLAAEDLVPEEPVSAAADVQTETAAAVETAAVVAQHTTVSEAMSPETNPLAELLADLQEEATPAQAEQAEQAEQDTTDKRRWWQRG